MKALSESFRFSIVGLKPNELLLRIRNLAPGALSVCLIEEKGSQDYRTFGSIMPQEETLLKLPIDFNERIIVFGVESGSIEDAVLWTDREVLPRIISYALSKGCKDKNCEGCVECDRLVDLSAITLFA